MKKQKRYKQVNEDRAFKSLTRMLDNQNFSKLTDTVIFQNPDKSVELFGKYKIILVNSMYVATKMHTFTEIAFYSLKNAVTWATLDRRNRVIDAKKVIELDLLLLGTSENLRIHRHLAKNAKTLESTALFATKVTEDEFKKKLILEELEEFINNSRDWQIKRFEQNTVK